MVSITLSIPEEIRDIMRKHDEINWSAYIKKCIMNKTKALEATKKIEDNQKTKDLLNLIGVMSEEEAKELENSVNQFRKEFKLNIETRNS